MLNSQINPDLEVIERYRPYSKYITVDGGLIHVCEMFSDAGSPFPDEPVILLHGLGGSVNDMTFRLAPLLAMYRRVICIDRPAHGLSGLHFDSECHSPAGQAALLAQVIDALGVKHFHLFGHSYGARVAAELAVVAGDAVKSLCLASGPFSNDLPPTWGLTLPVIRPAISRVASVFFNLSPDLIVQESVNHSFYPSDVPKDYVAHLDRGKTFSPDHINATLVQAFHLREDSCLLSKRLKSITCPVSVIYGEQDSILRYETHFDFLNFTFENADFHIMGGVGHMMHQTHTDICEAILRQVWGEINK